VINKEQYCGLYVHLGFEVSSVNIQYLLPTFLQLHSTLVIKVGGLRSKKPRVRSTGLPHWRRISHGDGYRGNKTVGNLLPQGPVNMVHGTVSPIQVAEGSPGSSFPHGAWHCFGGPAHPCDSPMHGAPFTIAVSRGQQ